VLGVEALVRWRRSHAENVPPSVFVPIAERIGFKLSLLAKRKGAMSAAGPNGKCGGNAFMSGHSKRAQLVVFVLNAPENGGMGSFYARSTS
jgi:hypothetical protein